ncbi:MAG: hypothetical protein M4579_005442 [Chaenotheca gracillima]|nr:MAG: hypothetical protein M4579_005442 [Chaenotheca gracillima]
MDDSSLKASSASPKRKRPSTRRPPFAKSRRRNQHVSSQGQIYAPPDQGSRPADYVYPPWNTLPYEILLQIFHSASLALESDKTIDGRPGGWLAGAARTCKAFAEPALTALYYAPPLRSPEQALKLLKVLKQSPDKTTFNYSVKVRRIEVEILQVLYYALPKKGRFDLGKLIQCTPRLEELDLSHKFDLPPYRDYEHGKVWHYDDNLFEALRDSNLKLRMWRWNARLAGIQRTPPELEIIHQRASFQALEYLALVGYRSYLMKRKGVSGNRTEVDMAAAISVLPKLQRLTFEKCEIVEPPFLELLPNKLRALTFTNCWNLTSDALQAFLESHGGNLRELSVNHNRSLSLSFLTTLADSCPHLEVLTADLLFYSTYINFDDSTPRFDTLLSPDEVPTWPTSLRYLEILQLRHWESDASATFFQSLVNAGSDLPDLRVLILKAIVKIPWRDRANFRDSWISKLRTVFLRRSAPPKGGLFSVGKTTRDRRSQMQNPTNSAASDSDTKGPPTMQTKQSPDGTPVRRSRRQKFSALANKDMVRTRELSVSESDHSRYGEESFQKRRRVSSDGSSIVEQEDISERESLENNGAADEQLPRQGMCQVVDVRIDDTRLAENQFDEADFLDDEASGDEDWNGDNNMPQTEAYAW